MTEFTPLASLLGGAMIGLSAVLLMALLGRVAGISGIAAGILPPWRAGEATWRAAFVAGLVLAPLFVWAATARPVQIEGLAGLPTLALAGLLVGFGAALGSGCTSGHGICGLSRLSTRSLVAVLTFMFTGALTVYVMRHLIGG